MEPALVGDQLRGEEVHLRRADEAGDEAAHRPTVQRQGISDLFDVPAVHDHDLVGQRHGLDLIVGDVDDGGAQPLMDALDLDPHLRAQRGIEVRQGFVKQKHLRLAHHRPSHRDALALAAG